MSFFATSGAISASPPPSIFGAPSRQSPAGQVSFANLPRRHQTHFHAHVVLKAESTFFQVPRERLVALSPVFRDMFSMPAPAVFGRIESTKKEGDSEANPIVLEGCKADDFARLMTLIYPAMLDTDWIPGDPVPGPTLKTEDEWISVLKLASLWQMDKIRKLAIEKLSAFTRPALAKIALAREHRVGSWLKEGILELASNTDAGNAGEIDAMAKNLGWETTARILAVKAAAMTTGTRDFPSKSMRCNHLHGCSKPSTSGTFTCQANHQVTFLSQGAGWNQLLVQPHEIRVDMAEASASLRIDEAFKLLDIFKDELSSFT